VWVSGEFGISKTGGRLHGDDGAIAATAKDLWGRRSPQAFDPDEFLQQQNESVLHLDICFNPTASIACNL